MIAFNTSGLILGHMERPKKIVLIFGALILLSAVLAVPVVAKIVTSTEAIFDADGTTREFGEEILVRITIKPGDTEIRDLQIDLSEREAFIDDTTFKHTIIPTGALVNVERNGHSFKCDHLATEESIVLSFNAYPKTLIQNRLEAIDVTYTCVQQGDTIFERDTITVDTSGSLWFQYLAASDSATASWKPYVGFFLFIIAIILLAYQFSRNKKLQSAVNSERRKMYALLGDVSQKLDQVQDSPSVRDDLKKRIERQLKSQDQIESLKSSVQEENSNSSQKKRSRFN